MKNWALIANKHAGTRSSKNFWRKIDEKFSKVGISVD
jgi:diacylglycerol kinase family enzyme